MVNSPQVRGMEHRQKREAEAEEQRRARQVELDAQQRETADQKRLEQDAFERQLQVWLLAQHMSGGYEYNVKNILWHDCPPVQSASLQVSQTF